VEVYRVVESAVADLSLVGTRVAAGAVWRRAIRWGHSVGDHCGRANV